MKINQNWIQNNEGVRKDIIVKGLTMAINKEVMIGSALFVIGSVLITRGVFRNGVNAYEKAEYKTMEELGIFTYY